MLKLLHKKNIRFLVRNVSIIFNYLFSPVDRLFWRQSEKILNYKPIIIIGPPRAGSTFLYQMIAKKFDVCFISNLHSFFYGLNKIYFTLLKILNLNSNLSEKDEVEVISTYGMTNSIFDVCEAAPFWNQWFPHYNTNKYKFKKKYFRDTISVISNMNKKPFLGKNHFANNYISEINTELTGNVLFVVPYRDIYYTCQSILIARRKSNSAWFSVRPKCMSEYNNLTEIEEVVYQYTCILESIILFINKNDFKNFVFLDYIKVCEEPNTELMKVKELYDDNTGILKINKKDLPVNKPSDKNRLSDRDKFLLDNAIKKIWLPTKNEFEKILYTKNLV